MDRDTFAVAEYDDLEFFHTLTDAEIAAKAFSRTIKKPYVVLMVEKIFDKDNEVSDEKE